MEIVELFKNRPPLLPIHRSGRKEGWPRELAPSRNGFLPYFRFVYRYRALVALVLHLNVGIHRRFATSITRAEREGEREGEGKKKLLESDPRRG